MARKKTTVVTEEVQPEVQEEVKQEVQQEQPQEQPQEQQPVKTEEMVVIDLHNGYYKLIASLGVRDIRTGVVYSEVICKQQDIHFYEAVQQ